MTRLCPLHRFSNLLLREVIGQMDAPMNRFILDVTSHCVFLVFLLCSVQDIKEQGGEPKEHRMKLCPCSNGWHTGKSHIQQGGRKKCIRLKCGYSFNVSADCAWHVGTRTLVSMYAVANLVHDLHDVGRLLAKKKVVLKARLLFSLIMDTVFMAAIGIKVGTRK